MTVLFLLAALSAGSDPNIVRRRFVYGKYYSLKEGNLVDRTDNTYWFYSPKDVAVGARLPVHIQIHGGGFTGGSPDEDAEADRRISAGLIRLYPIGSFALYWAAVSRAWPVVLTILLVGWRVEKEFACS